MEMSGQPKVPTILPLEGKKPWYILKMRWANAGWVIVDKRKKIFCPC
jgi:hypothetical protein